MNSPILLSCQCDVYFKVKRISVIILTLYGFQIISGSWVNSFGWYTAVTSY